MATMARAMDSQEFFARTEEQRAAEEKWDDWQKRCARLIRNPVVEIGVGCLVLFSFVLMILEADYSPKVPPWLEFANILLLMVYLIEIAFRLFVFRRAFFLNFFNTFDLGIIFIDVLAMVLGFFFEDSMPSFAALRICRMLRLTRVRKLVTKFPQLTLIVKGLLRGISAAFYGVTLLLMVLTIWSVIAVQFIQPVNERVAATGQYVECARCPEAFSTVRNSMLTFIQQIIAGDSWGQVTIPIIEAAPETAIFFGLVFVSVHITIMNVILAVIVDTALKASEEEKVEEQINLAQHHLVDICKGMDEDGSGDLTEDEIMAGFDANEEFRDLLLSMDIKAENMHMIFNILDSDMSGTVNYEEFITELMKMKKHDSHNMLVFIKHYITDIRRDVRDQLKLMQTSMIQTLQDIGHEPVVEDSGVTRCKTVVVPPGGFDVTEEGDAVGARAFVEEKERQTTAGQAAPPRKDGSLVEAASLKELGEELRHLRKVISDELLLSMKEISQKANAKTGVPFELDAPQYSQLPQADPHRPNNHQTIVPAGTPAVRRLERAPSSERSMMSNWALRGCCAPHMREEAAAVTKTLKPQPPRARGGSC